MQVEDMRRAMEQVEARQQQRHDGKPFDTAFSQLSRAAGPMCFMVGVTLIGWLLFHLS